MENQIEIKVKKVSKKKLLIQLLNFNDRVIWIHL